MGVEFIVLLIRLCLESVLTVIRDYLDKDFIVNIFGILVILAISSHCVRFKIVYYGTVRCLCSL